MYRLPKDFDASFFVGRRIELICFGENTVSFHFNDDLLVTVESAFAYVDRDGAEQLSEIPAVGTNVLKLLGKSVRQSTGSDDGTLNLAFENGDTLKILDTSDQYESYKIGLGDDTIIV